jgi:hypothetical protein
MYREITRKERKMNEHQREYIKLLVNSMYDIQKVRIAIDNRIDAFLRIGGVSYENMAEELRNDLSELTSEFEKRTESRISKAVGVAPIMRWLKKVKGIGPRYSGTLIGTVGTPPATVSKLWAMCGMDVIPICTECNKIAFWGKRKTHFVDRQVERRWGQQIKKGEEAADEQEFKRRAYIETEKKLCQCDDPQVKEVAPKRQYYKGLLLTHNPFLKSTCWKIAGQFVRQGDYYRKYYEQQKEYYLERDGEVLSLGHIENRARRATVKIFLSHLWEMWRKSLDMEAGEFYLRNKLGKEFEAVHRYIAPPYADLFDT